MEIADFGSAPAMAAASVVNDALSAIKSAERDIREELKSMALTRQERTILIAKLVDLAKARVAIASEVVSAYGRKQASPSGQGVPDADELVKPYAPGESIPPTEPGEEPP